MGALDTAGGAALGALANTNPVTAALYDAYKITSNIYNVAHHFLHLGTTTVTQTIAPSGWHIQPVAGDVNQVAAGPGQLQIPSYASPGFAPEGGLPVTASAITPPPVTLGPGSAAELPGPISDTAKTGSNMSDVTNLLGAGLDWLAGGTPSQITNALTAGSALSGTTPAPAPTPGQLAASSGTMPAGSSTTHPQKKGVYYKAVFDSAGNIVGYKEVKRRRRRRKLLTDSDAAGLIQLKSIFSGMRNGSAMIDAWIMTRGR